VIRHLRDQGQMAILLVEQYFDFAYDLADRFVVLRRGEILLEGRKQDVSREQVLQGVSV
jgi:urea transport system ATP-binding protein